MTIVTEKEATVSVGLRLLTSETLSFPILHRDGEQLGPQLSADPYKTPTSGKETRGDNVWLSSTVVLCGKQHPQNC